MQKTQRKETKKTNQKKKNNRIKNKSKFWKWINYVKKQKQINEYQKDKY